MKIACANKRCKTRTFTWEQARDGGRPPDYCSATCKAQAFYWRFKRKNGKRYAIARGYEISRKPA